jgi:hypothetical protein
MVPVPNECIRFSVTIFLRRILALAKKMSTIIQHPCLLINNDEDKATTLHVNLTEPPVWEDFELQQSLKVLKIRGDEDCNIDTTKEMLKLFVAVLPHSNIESIEFHVCEIKNLGNIAQWWAAKVRELNGVTDQKSLLRLSFENSDIDSGEATALNFMLEAGYIGEISVTECDFDNDGSAGIVKGLKANQSLRKVHFKVDDEYHRASLVSGVLEMVRKNKNILTLSLDLVNGPSCWDVYRSVEGSTSLQSLQLNGAELDVSDVGALMKVCQVVKSMKEISFKGCEFTQSGIQFLMDELSKHVALNHMRFENCQILEPYSAPFELRWRDVQVISFEQVGALVGQESLSSFFGGIADNNNIQSLDLSCILANRDQDFQSMCDTLISGNSGPTTLTMQELIQHRAPVIIEALQHATKLTELTIAQMDEDGMVSFAQGLTHMSSLRQLNIGFQGIDNHYSEEFFKSLCDSLEINTTLWSLSLRGIDSDNVMAKAYLPRIRYLLAINRVGRSSLLTANVPVGVWANVLARCPKDPDGIFFVLTGKPDLLARPSRKRSRRELSREVMAAD